MKYKRMLLKQDTGVFFSYLQAEEKILWLHAQLSNMAPSLSRYSAPNCSDVSQQIWNSDFAR